MKKVLALIFVCIFIFCGCQKNSNPTDAFSLPLQIMASLEGSDAVFTATILDNDCKIIFDENHALAGTELYFSPEGNKATWGGFTRSIKEGSFPAQEALIKAVRAICNTEISPTETDYGEKYTIDEMTIMVYYDKDNRLINGIGTEENGRHFKFNVLSFSQYEGQSNSSG